MSIFGTLFPLAAGVGLVIAFLNFLIWFRLKDEYVFLFAGAMSFAAGLVALCEGFNFNNPIISSFQSTLRLQNYAIGVTLVSMVWYVRLRLGTGRMWLAVAISIAWTIGLVANTLSTGNLTFSILSSLNSDVTAWSEKFVSPIGNAHQLRIIVDLTIPAIIVFLVDAMISAIRRGNSQAAIKVCLPTLFFMVVAGVHTTLVDSGVLKSPYAISLVFVAISVLLAADLVSGVARVAKLNTQLNIERQRWNELLNGINLAVLRISSDGRIEYVNPFLETICEQAASDLVGKTPDALFASNTAKEVEEIARQSKDWSSRSNVPREIVIPGGKIRNLVWFSVALKDLTGSPDGFITFGQDVTELREVELERDETLRELSRLSRALTLGELASTFAHELSQPIAAVLSNVQSMELLRSSGRLSDAESEIILSDILKDARRARTLMERVRSFMYNEQPEMDYFDLKEVVEESIEMLQPEALKNGVSVSVTSPEHELTVFGAKLELQQMITNVVLNGIQAAAKQPHGKVEVELSVGESEMITLTVRDNGAGLEGDTEKLFDPFVSSKARGTGIGLAVVRRVVERHGGEVIAGNSAAGGAKFDIHIPKMEESVA